MICTTKCVSLSATYTRAGAGGNRVARPHCKIHHFEYKILVFDTEFLVLNATFLVFNAKFINVHSLEPLGNVPVLMRCAGNLQSRAICSEICSEICSDLCSESPSPRAVCSEISAADQVSYGGNCVVLGAKVVIID